MPMLPFFRKQPPQDPTIVAMTGVRLGQRVLIVAEHEPSIAQHLGARVGLTGRILALGADAAGAARLESHAQRQGVLIDTGVTMLPLPAENGSFDAALVDDRREREAGLRTDALLHDVLRILRPGGRVIVLRRGTGRWTAGLFGRQPDPPDVSPVTQALSAAGFHNPRFVGQREGMAFVEAYKRGEGAN
jgi:SAM-dependent methyltransferase